MLDLGTCKGRAFELHPTFSWKIKTKFSNVHLVEARNDNLILWYL